MSLSEFVTKPSSSSDVSSAVGLCEKASGVRVLLVDGDPLTRAALAAMLMKQGFEVQSFDSHPMLHFSRHAKKIACGKLDVDLDQRRARWDGVEVPLTAGEFGVVVLLASNAGSCVDNRTVYDCLRHKGFLSGRGEKGFWTNVRSMIRRIRNKFRAIDDSFDELENARAFGYRWRNPLIGDAAVLATSRERPDPPGAGQDATPTAPTVRSGAGCLA
jgi:DNA-binding response OmpR family regulator